MVRQAIQHWRNRKPSGYWTEICVCVWGGGMCVFFPPLSWIHANESWESTATEMDQIKICVSNINRPLSLTRHIHKLG